MPNIKGKNANITVALQGNGNVYYELFASQWNIIASAPRIDVGSFAEAGWSEHIADTQAEASTFSCNFSAFSRNPAPLTEAERLAWAVIEGDLETALLLADEVLLNPESVRKAVAT